MEGKLAVVVCLGVAAVGTAHAKTVTYKYDGPTMSFYGFNDLNYDGYLSIDEEKLGRNLRDTSVRFSCFDYEYEGKDGCDGDIEAIETYTHLLGLQGSVAGMYFSATFDEDGRIDSWGGRAIDDPYEFASGTHGDGIDGVYLGSGPRDYSDLDEWKDFYTGEAGEWTRLTPVPLPASAALLGGGFGLMGGVGRRRRG